jgi:hypothetical protein
MARSKQVQKTMGEVADLGCIICGGPAQVHHIHTGIGKSRDDNKVIPLCILHHNAGIYGVSLHAGKKAFEKRFGTEQQLWELTQDLLRGIKC